MSDVRAKRPRPELCIAGVSDNMYRDLITGLKRSCWGNSTRYIDAERMDAANAIENLMAENEYLKRQCGQKKELCQEDYFLSVNEDTINRYIEWMKKEIETLKKREENQNENAD